MKFLATKMQKKRHKIYCESERDKTSIDLIPYITNNFTWLSGKPKPTTGVSFEQEDNVSNITPTLMESESRIKSTNSSFPAIFSKFRNSNYFLLLYTNTSHNKFP
jgi:hypothetical protein